MDNVCNDGGGPQATLQKEYCGAPYVLHNCTGLTAKLMLKDNHDFSVYFTQDCVESDYR